MTVNYTSIDNCTIDLEIKNVAALMELDETVRFPVTFRKSGDQTFKPLTYLVVMFQLQPTIYGLPIKNYSGMQLSDFIHMAYKNCKFVVPKQMPLKSAGESTPIFYDEIKQFIFKRINSKELEYIDLFLSKKWSLESQLLIEGVKYMELP